MHLLAVVIVDDDLSKAKQSNGRVERISSEWYSGIEQKPNRDEYMHRYKYVFT